MNKYTNFVVTKFPEDVSTATGSDCDGPTSTSDIWLFCKESIDYTRTKYTTLKINKNTGRLASGSLPLRHVLSLLVNDQDQILFL